MARKKAEPVDLGTYHRQQVAPHLSRMPWVLRITDHKKRPSPVFVVKYNKPVDEDSDQTRLVERGVIYGDTLRRCLPAIQQIISRIHDESDRPLDLQPFLRSRALGFRGNLPLDQVTGTKLALLFRLQERVKDLDRVELMARRIDNFTEEEATYWLSRILHFGKASSRWAVAGMRIMLGGMPGDPEITHMLHNLGIEERSSMPREGK